MYTIKTKWIELRSKITIKHLEFDLFMEKLEGICGARELDVRKEVAITLYYTLFGCILVFF